MVCEEVRDEEEVLDGEEVRDEEVCEGYLEGSEEVCEDRSDVFRIWINGRAEDLKSQQDARPLVLQTHILHLSYITRMPSVQLSYISRMQPRSTCTAGGSQRERCAPAADTKLCRCTSGLMTSRRRPLASKHHPRMVKHCIESQRLCVSAALGLS
jgi:hypothetical protein